MNNEKEFQVVDAKQVFLKWNALRLKNISDNVVQAANKYIHLIPFFLQINNKLLPGYVDIDTPVGIFSYLPDEKTIEEVKNLNGKFRYQAESVIKNYAVEAIYFNINVINEKKICWVFNSAFLDKNKILSLKEKVSKIEKWFSSKGLNIEFIVISVNEFFNCKSYLLKKEKKSLYLDKFYSESIVLAGKYPVWWLIPPSKEKDYEKYVEHIKQARFVDNEEYIDFGRADDFEYSDIVKHAVSLVQQANQSPETCMVELLLLDQKNSAYPKLDGISNRIKKILYTDDVNVSLLGSVVDILHDAIDGYNDKKHILSPIKLFSQIKETPRELSLQIVNEFLGDGYVSVQANSGIESIITQIKFCKAISHEISQIFENIVTCYDNDKTFDLDESLLMIVNNMLLFLSDGESKVPLYNNKKNDNIIFDRIHLKQVTDKSKSYWDLILDSSMDDKKTIEGFNCLLGLLAWCWLNRVVNNSTQVSIDSSEQQIKQIEAYSILEKLIQYLKLDAVLNIPAKAFKEAATPLQSLLFVSFIEAEKKDTNHSEKLKFTLPSKVLLSHSEQLIIDSWGEVYTRKYSDNIGVLKCLCDWMHHSPIGDVVKPPPFNIFGHGVGDSTRIAQRVEQIFDDLKDFFYQKGHAEGRFIVKMASEFYLIEAGDVPLHVKNIKSQRALMLILEAALLEFKPTAFEQFSLNEYPLHKIYQNNKKNVVQVYFQVINRSCHSWVVDEKGSLWSDVLTVFSRESFLTHWLYLFKSIRVFLKKLNTDDYALPSLEINQIIINKLGVHEFYTVGAEAVTGNKDFIDIKVSVNNENGSDQLSLYCDEREFLFGKYQQTVFSECVEYLSARKIGEGRSPIYVTAIDVPVKSFNVKNVCDIQVSQILKIKRSFEHRFNKSLDG